MTLQNGGIRQYLWFLVLDEQKCTLQTMSITGSYLLAVVGNSWAEGQAGACQCSWWMWAVQHPVLGFSKKLLEVFLPDLQTIFHHYKCNNWLFLYNVNKSLFGKGNFRKRKCEEGEYPVFSAKAEVLCLCLFYHILIILPPVTCGIVLFLSGSRGSVNKITLSVSFQQWCYLRLSWGEAEKAFISSSLLTCLWKKCMYKWSCGLSTRFPQRMHSAC